MGGPTEKLVDIGILTLDTIMEVEVVYVIDMGPGDRPGIQEIEGALFPVGERDDLADAMGKELILKLRDGRKLPLSLADATGRFRAEGSIQNI